MSLVQDRSLDLLTCSPALYHCATEIQYDKSQSFLLIIGVSNDLEIHMFHSKDTARLHRRIQQSWVPGGTVELWVILQVALNWPSY